MSVACSNVFKLKITQPFVFNCPKYKVWSDVLREQTDFCSHCSIFFVLVLVLLICSGDSVISRCAFSADEIRELWMEYEDNATLEAKVVKDFDKV